MSNVVGTAVALVLPMAVALAIGAGRADGAGEDAINGTPGNDRIRGFAARRT